LSRGSGASACRCARAGYALKEAWTGSSALGLFPHALANVARLLVREVVSALHFKTDLRLGTVAFDYLES
jgi:acetoacetate decarboxylase